MACAQTTQPWLICGTHGTITYDSDMETWHVKYYKKTDLPPLKASNSLAAPNRMYSNGEKIPWHYDSFKDCDFKEINFFDKCYKYFALKEKPFVPIEQTRELMRTLHLCRATVDNITQIQKI